MILRVGLDVFPLDEGNKVDCFAQIPFSQHVEARHRRATSATPTQDKAAVLREFSYSREGVGFDDVREEDEDEEGERRRMVSKEKMIHMLRVWASLA